MLNQYSKVLFWDVDVNTMSTSDHADFIIQRVCMYGTWDDWQILKKEYGLDKISNALTTARYLDKKTLNYFSLILDVPKERFRCYTLQQSENRHWDY